MASTSVAMIPELWSDEVIKTYKDSLAFAGKTLADKIDDDVYEAAMKMEVKPMIPPQIGDRVALMDTLPDRLRGLEWFYVGDNYRGEAVVMSHGADVYPTQASKMCVADAEQYDISAKLRATYASMKGKEGEWRLKPLKYEDGTVVDLGVIKSTVFYGTAIMQPEWVHVDVNAA